LPTRIGDNRASGTTASATTILNEKNFIARKLLLARWYLYVIFSREALGGFGSADRSGSRRKQAPNEAVERIKALFCDTPIEWEEYK
jgi:hypothetical protein